MTESHDPFSLLQDLFPDRVVFPPGGTPDDPDDPTLYEFLRIKMPSAAVGQRIVEAFCSTRPNTADSPYPVAMYNNGDSSVCIRPDFTEGLQIDQLRADLRIAVVPTSRDRAYDVHMRYLPGGNAPASQAEHLGLAELPHPTEAEVADYYKRNERCP